MAFSLKAILGMDSGPFEKGLKGARKRISGAAKGMLTSLAPIAGFAGFSILGKSAIDLGSRLSDIATQLDITTDALQALEFASEEAGVGTEILERGLRNLKQRTQEAVDGNKRYSEALDRLGINAEEFTKLPLEQRLEAIAKAADGAASDSEAFADVSVILGQRAGPKLQEVLQVLAKDGFPALQKAAGDAGRVMDEGTIKKLDVASDRIAGFKRRMTVMTGELLVRAIPALKILGQGFGFIGDVVGAGAAVVVQYGQSLGRVITSVVRPGISALQGLGFALKSASQALSGNFSGARESAKKAKEAFGSIKEEIKAIPGEMKQAGSDLARTMDSAMDTLGDSLDERSQEIARNLGEITGSAEDASDAVEKAGSKSAAPKARAKAEQTGVLSRERVASAEARAERLREHQRRGEEIDRQAVERQRLREQRLQVAQMRQVTPQAPGLPLHTSSAIKARDEAASELLRTNKALESIERELTTETPR